jgi:6-phosphogluconolactonase
MAADVTIQGVHELALGFVRLAEEASRRAIAERGTFSMAIPGGSAAEVLLPHLVPASIDWAKISVFWVDERMVPPDDADSNFRVARSAWLDRVPIPSDRIHRMRGEDPDPAEAAEAYSRLLQEQLGHRARIDMVLLGMGGDGHVASLFPGHRLLRTWDRDVAVLDDAPKPPMRRMTLTLRTLTAARHIVVFASGKAKAEAIQDVLGNEESELPVALATMGDTLVTFLLDPEAASKIQR